MNIPIYENRFKEEFALRLIDEDGITTLCIVNKATGVMITSGRLLSFTEKGHVTLAYAVNRDAAASLGIPLDDDLRVIID